MKIYYHYILKCSDGTYYTGMTNNLERRFWEHESGTNEDSYTFSRRPIELQFFEEFTDVNQCIEFEKKIKKLSSKKKQALFEKNWDRLHDLAKCRNETNSKNYKREK
ncbi:MAG: GIY-YIG nuclease family protein [Cytophagaceae bacterium]|nr:GIY-YIG nuclease family protein [Cytophagaceae bacterium]MBL0300728.1 GIY-YIG nuclease family protein [Cytophagaceae bacterium]MBL0327670.1 GIY-YIG nuclease family protein [Cytophagaceae bacterium]